MSKVNDPIEQAFQILKKKYKADNILLNLRNTTYFELVEKIKLDRLAAITLGLALLSHASTIDRFFGITLLTEICNPVETGEEADAQQIGKAFVAAAKHEKTLICNEALAHGLRFVASPDTLQAVLDFSFNDAAEIRWSATCSLGSFIDVEDTLTVYRRLVELSNDIDPDIRDWATMWLGSCLNLYDNKQATEPIIARLGDRHIATRIEAVYALAESNNRRAVGPLKRLLMRNVLPLADKAIEAAGLLGLPELQEYVGGWHDADSKNQDNANNYLSEWAIKRCSADPIIKDSVDDDWLGDEWYINVLNGVRKPIKFRIAQD
jgi:hypothetical protein